MFQEKIKEPDQSNKEPNLELVFFDTFLHDDNNEETHLDLVKFKNPVLIKEIRVIPLGAKVDADFPGGWRLGATNPSSFDLIFYFNDLTKKSLNKFTKFGNFEYKDTGNIKFTPNLLKPTNSLVLKGKYINLTLAVFAELIDENSIKTEIDELIENVDQKENNDFNAQLDHETDTLFSISECSTKTDNIPANFERLNGKECNKEIKLIVEDDSNSLGKREIQPISSPTNDNPNVFDYVDNFNNHDKLVEPINDSESISSIDEVKNENRPQSNLDDKIETVVVNDSDLEPISPEQLDANKTEQINESTNEQQTADLLYISNLTEKVSDDEMCDDFNPDFDSNEHQRLESRASTNSEDLEEISSEEEYFEDVAGADTSELFVDYSDDEINQFNYKNEFNAEEYVCKPLKSLNDPSLTSYENLRAKKFKINNQLAEDIIYFDSQDKDSKWIEFIEILDLNSLDLDNDEQFSEILIKWVKIGIDFETALKQKNTAFKVRHLKSGLKLLYALVQTNSKIINQILNERILETIYKLFFKPYMTFPIKLLLIRTLDILTDNSSVIEHVLNHRYKLGDEFNQNLRENLRTSLEESHKSKNDEQQQSKDFNLLNSLNDLKNNLDQVFSNDEKTIYQLLLILMMNTKETRVTIALTILLRKIHFYEFLLNFKQDAELQLSNKKKDEQLIDTIASNLNEITSSFVNSKQLFGQRLRYLPAKTQFDVKPCVTNVTFAIYKWFNHLDFLNLIIDLVAIKDQKLINSILNFLNEILLEQEGTAYFSSSKVYAITNRLLEITTNKQSTNSPKTDLDKSTEESLNQRLEAFNLTLKHNLYILELIDQINEIQLSDEFKQSNDETQLCLLYNKLYSMIFSELGSRCLIKQFCNSRNLEVLIKFLVFNKERSVEKSKLISFHYAINLLIYTIQYSKERLCELLIKFNDEFVNLSSYSSVLSKWLSPLKRGIKFNYNESTFKLLVSNLKQHSERLKDLKENCTYRVSPDLICCVRILHHLCIESNETFLNDQLLPDNQLKFKYGLIQLFTLKGINYILTILERLAEIFLKPSHLNSSLIGNQGYFLITLFKPSIDILKQTLLNLTHCRGSDFKDISPISSLLKVYSLMLVFPLQSPYHLNSIQINNEVISILHSYTQLNVNINEVEDEVFIKSIWTKMVKEVINFTTSKPFNYSHGLYLLSQLLPLPLTVKRKDQNDSNEIARLLNFRKLWSAHIHVLFSDIENMLQKLVLCLSPLIQCLLRRVCYQLVDLSSHAGVIVSKCLLSVLDEHLGVENELNDNLRSVLDLILFLLKYNLFKHAFTCTVNTLNSSIKKDERLDKTIRKAIELFKSNEELSKNYSPILTVLDTKKELTDTELDLTQMEKLNLHYNNREDNIQFDEDLNDLTSTVMNLNKKLEQYDLIALSKKYLDANFDVRDQLMVIYKNEEPNYEENYKLTNKHKHEQPLITKDYSGNVKRPYVAPLRGRGFQRGSNSLGRLHHLHDPFRSRPPNTSRPPSMHVDDFVLFEQNTQNNIKRQKQDFNNKFNKLNQGQRTNLRTVYYNYRQPNTRMNNLNSRNTFNRYSNIQANYNNGGLNNSNNNNVNNKMRKQNMP